MRLTKIVPLSVLVLGIWLSMESRESKELGATSPTDTSQSPPMAPSRAPNIKPSTPGQTKTLGSDSIQPTPPPLSDRDLYRKPSLILPVGMVEDRWVTQGDVLVDPADVQDGVEGTAFRMVKMAQVSYWREGRVPVALDPNVNTTTVKAAIAEIEAQTRVRFVAHEDEPDFIVFRPAHADLCQSYLGRKGGEQEVVLAASCSKGQVLHELMHALGFVHEHSREDRDRYIKIVWDEILPAYRNQFQKVPAAVSQPVDVPFDFESILLYPSYAFSAGERPTITEPGGSAYSVNRAMLSLLDVEKVNLLYGGAAAKG
ncbi:MAG: M12 family metallopeptidase [Proteobacteria bacterium]|nr:M12 family metallopeptidase [Pseudomonadota bacterium]